MLLVIDAGNTHTVVGLYDGEALRAHWRIFTSHYRTEDEFRILISMLLQEEAVDREEVSGCCIASVVPPVDGPLTGVCRHAFGAAPLMVGPGVKTGLVIQVDNPKEVGADRIVNAVGAREQFDGPMIIIDFGTATTFDVITTQGEYRGGCIMPGIEIGADALFQKCAKLPRIDISRPSSALGKNTVDQIRAGLTLGYADMVDGMITRIRSELGEDPTVVSTGGYAAVIADVASGIQHVDPLLTLKGLRAVYKRNQPQRA